MENVYGDSTEETISIISELIGDLEDVIIGPNGATLKFDASQLLTAKVVIDSLTVLNRQVRQEWKKWKKLDKSRGASEVLTDKEAKEKGYDPYPDSR